MERITYKTLHGQLRRIAKRENRPEGLNTGALVLYHDSQGYQLQEVIESSGRHVASEILTAREMYYFMRGWITAINA